MSRPAHQPEPAGPAVDAVGPSATLRDRLQQLLAFASLIVIVIFFSFASPVFFTYSNITSILFSTVVIGVPGGRHDLRHHHRRHRPVHRHRDGAVRGDVRGLHREHGPSGPPGGGPGHRSSAGWSGFVNGFNVAVLGLPPFIATLAMMLVAEGLALVISGSSPIYFTDAPSYTKISTGELIPACRTRS